MSCPRDHVALARDPLAWSRLSYVGVRVELDDEDGEWSPFALATCACGLTLRRRATEEDLRREAGGHTREAEKTTTIRAVLELLGGVDHVAMEDWTREHELDREVIARFCTHNSPDHAGEVFVYCGGRALVGFYHATRQPLYLVLDDLEVKLWWSTQPLPEGPPPRERLRLVRAS